MENFKEQKVIRTHLHKKNYLKNHLKITILMQFFIKKL